MERRGSEDTRLNTDDEKEVKKVRKRWSLLPNKLGRSISFRKESNRNGGSKLGDLGLRRGVSEHRVRLKPNKQKQIVSISSPTVELPAIDISEDSCIYSSVTRKPDLQLAALELFNDTMTEQVGVAIWLRTLELEQYITYFKPNATVDSVLHLTEQNLLDLGIKSPVHRARISSNLVLIRQKFTKYNSAGHIGTLPRKKSKISLNRTHRYSSGQEGETSKFYISTPNKMDPWRKEPTPEQLKKDLEMELKLPHDDIRSHAWFHGGISREKAVKSLKQNGEFLVRDSISKPGSYVLGVMWHGEVLHFVINKTIQQEFTPYAKLQYQMETNYFDSVPALVMYYHGKKPVSRTSTAVIKMPVNRTLPLSYTDSKYAETNLKQCDTPVYGAILNRVITPRMSGLPLQRQLSKINSESLYDCPNSRPIETNGDQQPALIAPQEDDELYSYPRKLKESTKANSDLTKTDKNLNLENLSYFNDKPVRDDDESNVRTNDRHFSTLTEEPSQVLYGAISRERFLSDESEPIAPGSDEQDGIQRAAGIMQHPRIPTNQMHSQFHPSEFKCNILPDNHRILDIHVLRNVQQRLMNGDPQVIAQHILSLDVELLQMLSISDGCLSGLELLSLPQGHCLRKDLQERSNCLRLWCSVTIVYCMEIEKRVKLLHCWIQIAEATVFKMGDLFAFGAIMEGLACKQVQELKLTWELLRKSYTDSAFLHDTKLRSQFKEHQQGQTLLKASQISIPAISPIIQLLEMDWTPLTSRDWLQPNTKEMVDSLPKDELWVQPSDSFGLEVFRRHLALARNIINKTTNYQLNANSKLLDFVADSDMLDSFRTELHMVILWGIKGLQSKSKERFIKYEQMLNLLVGKAEPSL